MSWQPRADEVSFISDRYIEHVPMCVLNAIIVNGASHLTEFDQAGGVEERHARSDVL